MRRVFLFNPENDIALSHGRANFTPPKNAALLHRYGAPLMRWFGDENDYVLVPELSGKELADRKLWVARIDESFSKGPRLVTSLAGLEIDELCPWGWSLNACRQFRDAGAPESLLDSHLRFADRHRELSHRRSSARIMSGLYEAGLENLPPIPFEAFTAEDVERFLSETPRLFAKSPWSSSGRGVRYFDLTVDSRERVVAHCMGIISSQGSVMLEKALHKAEDFAMLFNVGDEGAVFIGYSLFFNSRETAYGGNMIASDEEIATRLAAYVAMDRLNEIKHTLESVLEFLRAEGYRGPAGVDMMIYESGEGKFDVAPCVELNLRLTMGFLANRLFSLLCGKGDDDWHGKAFSSVARRMFVVPKFGNAEATPVDGLLLSPCNPCFGFYID